MPIDAEPCYDAGDTTWLLISCGLVLTMSPALAFFEAGMLRSKNTLSLTTQIFTGVISLSLLWMIIGYSLTYGDSLGGVIGDPTSFPFFVNVSYSDCSPHAPNVPAAAFALFQMMFAVITPLLITGAYAERVSFRVFFAFTIIWEVLVYYPVAHWVWGGGWLGKWGTVDFAGGITIHTTAGIASLISAVMIGRRRHFKDYYGEFPPSSVPLAATGAALLWLGWFGFNGGSALQAGQVATSALVSTQMGAVSSAFVWLVLGWWRGKPSTTGLLNGTLAGLAGVTPASGYINSPATLLLGLILGISSYTGCHVLKHIWQIDDALEVSMVHGLTGAIGAIYIGFFADHSLNPNGPDGLIHDHGMQIVYQLVGVLVCGAYAGVVTVAILLVLKKVFGSLRLSEEEEEAGADWCDHGEIAYHKLHVLDENDKLAIHQHVYVDDNGSLGFHHGGSGPNSPSLIGSGRLFDSSPESISDVSVNRALSPPPGGSPFLRAANNPLLPRNDDYRKHRAH